MAAGALRSVRKIGTGCDPSFNSPGMRRGIAATITAAPVSNLLRQSGQVISDGARRTTYGKPFVDATMCSYKDG